MRVGLVPQGSALEVYIAPQLSKRKAMAKPKKRLVVPEPAPFPALDDEPAVESSDPTSEPVLGRLQPIPETVTSSLETLVEKYNKNLRVAVDPETCFRAITGTHIRVRISYELQS